MSPPTFPENVNEPSNSYPNSNSSSTVSTPAEFPRISSIMSFLQDHVPTSSEGGIVETPKIKKDKVFGIRKPENQPTTTIPNMPPANGFPMGPMPMPMPMPNFPMFPPPNFFPMLNPAGPMMPFPMMPFSNFPFPMMGMPAPFNPMMNFPQLGMMGLPPPMNMNMMNLLSAGASMSPQPNFPGAKPVGQLGIAQNPVKFSPYNRPVHQPLKNVTNREDITAAASKRKATDKNNALGGEPAVKKDTRDKKGFQNEK